MVKPHLPFCIAETSRRRQTAAGSGNTRNAATATSLSTHRSATRGTSLYRMWSPTEVPLRVWPRLILDIFLYLLVAASLDMFYVHIYQIVHHLHVCSKKRYQNILVQKNRFRESRVLWLPIVIFWSLFCIYHLFFPLFNDIDFEFVIPSSLLTLPHVFLTVAFKVHNHQGKWLPRFHTATMNIYGAFFVIKEATLQILAFFSLHVQLWMRALLVFCKILATIYALLAVTPQNFSVACLFSSRLLALEGKKASSHHESFCPVSHSAQRATVPAPFWVSSLVWSTCATGMPSCRIISLGPASVVLLIWPD